MSGFMTLAERRLTVFLDELADIPLPWQVKLLRVLEQGEVFLVGSTQAEPLNVRLTGSHAPGPDEEGGEGSFRHDAFSPQRLRDSPSSRSSRRCPC